MATSSMIESSKAVLRQPSDTSAHTELSSAARNVGAAIKALLDAAKSMSEIDLDEYIDKISQAISELDAAAISATVGLLENTAPVGKTTQSLEEDVVQISRDLATSIKTLVHSQKESPLALAKAAKGTSHLIPKLAELSKQLAGTTADSQRQLQYLSLAKEIAGEKCPYDPNLVRLVLGTITSMQAK